MLNINNKTATVANILLRKIAVAAKPQNFENITKLSLPEYSASIFVVIHSLTRGFAIGGCRIKSYPNDELAKQDATKLAQGMSYKAAIHNLPHGGGKAVINIAPNNPHRQKVIIKLAEIINQLNGQYVTSFDYGVSPADIDIIEKHTPYVIRDYAVANGTHETPCKYTAIGTYLSMLAGLEHQNKPITSPGLTFAIAGVGNVGSKIANFIAQFPEHNLIVADPDPKRLTQIKQIAPNATIVDHQNIIAYPCDVLLPCALGSTITSENINQIQAKLIVGAANNILAKNQLAADLAKRNITYIPDFVSNGGGLIFAALSHANADEYTILKRVQTIKNLTANILNNAKKLQTTPLQLAIKLAQEQIISYQDTYEEA